MTTKIAMWSGPRNISTALMRAFENRSDTTVADEPFYAAYLAATGLDHPGREAILASQPRHAAQVIAQLTGPIPRNPDNSANSVWYLKLMAHHILPNTDLKWLADPSFVHVFLLRDPHAMLLSLRKVLGNVTADQTGLPQQVRLMQTLQTARGIRPIVIHSDDVLADPQAALRRLCEQVGIEFQPQMLSWRPGPRSSDGVWAPHWYGSLYASTGFAAPRPSNESLPAACRPLLEDCQALYQQLANHRAERSVVQGR